MTSEVLFGIYEGISVPGGFGGDAPPFAVRPVPGLESYFVGRDSAGRACLLVKNRGATGRKPPPIRLENLDVQFELACRITGPDGSASEGQLTVVSCRSLEPEIIRYFLSFCRIIMRHMGDAPSRTALASAVQRIASIFQNIKKPPVRSLNGLFGELFVISRSRSPAQAVAAWRIDETSRFDFSAGDVRMDVKSCAGRVRAHTFTYDQCNPPPNTQAVVASLLVERIPDGISIDDLVASIEARVFGEQELVFKLHNIVASTLGEKFSESLSVNFDPRLAESSLQFFDLREVPAVRSTLPAKVSDVRFTVDLSGLVSLYKQTLIDRDSHFWDLVPQ